MFLHCHSPSPFAPTEQHSDQRIGHAPCLHTRGGGEGCTHVSDSLERLRNHQSITLKCEDCFFQTPVCVPLELLSPLCLSLARAPHRIHNAIGLGVPAPRRIHNAIGLGVARTRNTDVPLSAPLYLAMLILTWGNSYMAPEMVILPKQPRSVRVGYSNVRGSGMFVLKHSMYTIRCIQ